MSTTSRDTTIDLKINELKDRKENLEKELESIPKFITNMIISTSDKKCNLRTCTTVEDFYNAYKILHTENMLADKFNEFIADTGNKLDCEKIHGYTIDEWDTDIHNAICKITISKKLTAINSALKELEKYYSGDRKEENAFNSLLDSIANI